MDLNCGSTPPKVKYGGHDRAPGFVDSGPRIEILKDGPLFLFTARSNNSIALLKWFVASFRAAPSSDCALSANVFVALI
jgi:hypothetical protein